MNKNMRPIVVVLAMLLSLLGYACGGGSSGGDSSSKSSETGIMRLVLVLGTQEREVNFDGGVDATIDHSYSGENPPDSVTIQTLILSDAATANKGTTIPITITDNKVYITVTAEDGTSREYTIIFNFAKALSSDNEIRRLVLAFDGQEREVSFDDGAHEATIDYLYVSGETRPDVVTIKTIVLSDEASADVRDSSELTIPESNNITITVTAEDGTEQAYSIIVNFIEVAGKITSLNINIGGEQRQVTFGNSATVTVAKAFPSGTDLPENITITEISVSPGAIATSNDETIDNNRVLPIVTDDNTGKPQITITVEAQNGRSADYTIIFEFVEIDPTLEGIVTLGRVPDNIEIYENLAQEVLKPYAVGASIVARYVTVSGSSDGSSWSLASSDLATLLDSIDDASSDKVYLILVAEGYYTRSSNIRMKNNVAIVGGFEVYGSWSRPAEALTLFLRARDGDIGRVFDNSCDSSNPMDHTALLYGATVTGNGGGMLNKYASPSIINVIFRKNTALLGGGLYNEHSSPRLTNVIFSGNRTTTEDGVGGKGGGIYNTESDPVLFDVRLEDNSASFGAGIYNYKSSPEMARVIFSKNEATVNGGGMYNYESSPVMVDAGFASNTAEINGGGVYNSMSSLRITNATFSKNSSVAGFDGGGGMLNLSSSPVLTNLTFYGNSAKNGGAVYNYNSSPRLTNVTVTDNSATNYGGGMYNDNNEASGPVIVNSIFWGNKDISGKPEIALSNDYVLESGSEEKITIAYSVVKGGTDSSALAIYESIDTAVKSSDVVVTNPELGLLADNSGFVETMLIGSRSSAANRGVYVRRNGDNYYYSTDNDNWYSDFSSSGLTDSTSDANAEAEGSIGITATDAVGRQRTDRPDAGAYEVFTTDIAYLRINMGEGAQREKVVAFNSYGQASISYEYLLETTPDEVTIAEIEFADGIPLEQNVGVGTKLDISNNTALIPVTAQDGSTRDYIVSFVFTPKEQVISINSLVLDIGGATEKDEPVDFSPENLDNGVVKHTYYSDETPDKATIVQIAFADGILPSQNVAVGTELDISNDTALITVRAQNGNTRDYTITFILTRGNSSAIKPELSLTRLEYGSQSTTQILVILDVTSYGLDHYGDPLEEIDSYTLEHSESADFVSLVKTKFTGAPFLLQDMTPGTKYYIRASATNSPDLTSDYTETVSHVTYPDLDPDPDPDSESLTLAVIEPLGHIPKNGDLGRYDEFAQDILKVYALDDATVDVEIIYVVEDGKGDADGSSWNHADNSLIDALGGISDAGAGKVYFILVSSGNYSEASTIRMTDHVAIIGGWESGGGWDRSGDTVLSGDDSRRVFYNSDDIGSTSLLYGVTITDGFSPADGGGMYNKDSSPTLINIIFSDNSSAYDGGGMYNNNSSPTMTNITFSNNSVPKNGAGMYNNNSSPDLTNVTFSGNLARGGGGMYNLRSSPTMTNVTFSDNTVTATSDNTVTSEDNGNGGGMYNEDSSPDIINITFSGNSAKNGAGMYNNNSSPTMTNIAFSDNSASGSGGGMHNGYSSPTMTNVTFSGNSASSGGGMFNLVSVPTMTMTNVTFSANSAINGGGMNNFASAPTMTNITFASNSASSSGGGIYNDYSSSTITNITFSGNSASSGGGIYIERADSTYTIVNSIFWDNSADTGAQIHINERSTGARIILAYSVIAGVVPADIITTANLTTNPSLADLTTDTGSFVATMAIGSSSSAKDAGVYVRRLDYTDQSDDVQTAWYYSEDNNNWYTDFDSSGLTDSTSDAAAEHADSIDITATDATGTARAGRPDAGAYEARGGASP